MNPPSLTKKYFAPLWVATCEPGRSVFLWGVYFVCYFQGFLAHAPAQDHLL